MQGHIFIVDDSPTLRTSLTFCLENAGYTVTEAIHGEDGLKKLQKIERSRECLSLIISDINMPVMDGITFIKKVKTTSLRFVPILILTTEQEMQKKKEARIAGAAGWLTKPFKPEQLLWVVKKFVL